MKFLANKWTWIVACVLTLLALPKLDFGQRKWVFAFAVVGTWVAWGLKKLPAKMAGIITVVVGVLWAITYFQKIGEMKNRTPTSAYRTSEDE